MKYTEGGYTVLEVMIFLAISTFLLAFTIPAISGQQARTYFTQGVRDLDSKLQDIFNDVSTGYFDNSARLSCSINSADVPTISNTTSPDIGTNEQCMLLGKAVWASTDTTGNPPNNEKLTIYTVVGARLQRSGASFVPVGAITNTKAVIDDRLREVYQLQNGLRIKSITGTSQAAIVDSPQFEMAAFLTNFNSSSDITSTQLRNTNLHPKLISGSQQTNFRTNPTSCFNGSVFRNPGNDQCSEYTFTNWKICVTDAGERFHARISLEASSVDLKTNIQFDGVTC